MKALKFFGVIMRRDAGLITRLAERADQAKNAHDDAIERFKRAMTQTNTLVTVRHSERVSSPAQHKVRHFKGHPF